MRRGSERPSRPPQCRRPHQLACLSMVSEPALMPGHPKAAVRTRVRSGVHPVGLDKRVVTGVYRDDVMQGSHYPESSGLPHASLPQPPAPAGPSLSPRLCLFPEGPEWGAHGVWPRRVSGPPRSSSDSTARFSAALTRVPLSGGFPVTFPPTRGRTSGWLPGLSIRNMHAHMQAVLWAELRTPRLNTKGRGRWVTCEPVSFQKPLNCLPQ